MPALHKSKVNKKFIRQLAITVSLGLHLSTLDAFTESLQPTILNFSHWVPSTHFVHLGIEAWVQNLEKESEGTIKVNIFPAQQLGKAEDHYDMVRFGITDIAWVNPGYQRGRHPVFSIGQLPFLINDGASGSEAFDRWYRKYAQNEMHDVHYCLAFAHDPGILHSKRKIESIADLRGVRVRPPNATVSRYLSSFGAIPINLSAAETREALDKGVAEAITFPWATVLNFGLDTSVNFHLDMPLYTSPTVFIINKRTYKKLASKAKAALDKLCSSSAARKLGEDWAIRERAGRPTLQAMPGHILYTLSPKALAAWHSAVVPLEENWYKIVAGKAIDGRTALQKLRDELKHLHTSSAKPDDPT